MILGLVLGLSLQMAAPVDPAGAFASDFAAICLAGYGDLKLVRGASKLSHYHATELLDGLPQSFLAKKSDLTLVYRGEMPDEQAAWAPQCMLQTDQIPGGDFKGLSDAIERSIKGLVLSTEPHRSTKPMVEWVLSAGKKNLKISLIDDNLLGNRNIRLSVTPYVPDRR